MLMKYVVVRRRLILQIQIRREILVLNTIYHNTFAVLWTLAKNCVSTENMLMIMSYI